MVALNDVMWTLDCGIASRQSIFLLGRFSYQDASVHFHGIGKARSATSVPDLRQDALPLLLTSVSKVLDLLEAMSKDLKIRGQIR